MAHDHLYQPAPCSHWPEDLLQAVGATYREAQCEGLEQLACLDHAKAAYIAAGGSTESAWGTVLGIIASLSAERGDWLWEPAQEGVDRLATE